VVASFAFIARTRSAASVSVSDMGVSGCLFEACQ